ncbi:hypothetical protein ACSBR2_029308 [Camellia fascicularis]
MELTSTFMSSPYVYDSRNVTMENSNKSIDPNSGFCSQTKIFHSLRPTVVLPPQTTPLSAGSFALSLQLSCPWRDPTALINSNTGQRISYFDFIQKIKTLAVSLQTLTGLSKGDTAFILSPTSILIPIIYFSLLSIGIVVAKSSYQNPRSLSPRQQPVPDSQIFDLERFSLTR